MKNSSDNPQLPTTDEELPSGAFQVIREEIPALRDLLGLNLNRRGFTKFPSPNILAQSSGIKDVLFLAIDIEGETCQPTLPEEYQLGISILDTRHLQTLISKHLSLYSEQNTDGDDDETELRNILQTYNLCHGSPTYCLKAQRKLLFGSAEELAPAEMNAKIQTLIAGRDVILVVHCGTNDLRFLDRLEIPIQPLYTLDTQKTAQNPLTLVKRPSLESLQTTLEIPFVSKSLHTGGNDANYTLRSLLMTAVKDSEGEEGLSREQIALLGVLRGIARVKISEDRIRQSQGVQKVQGKGRLARLEAKRRKKERKAVRKLARENGTEEGEGEDEEVSEES